MKLKSIHIYLLLFLIAIIGIIYFSTQENSVEEKSITEQEMPKDDIHSQFNNSQQPSGGNVTSEFKDKLNSLEEYVSKNPNDTAKVKEYADLLYAAHNPKKSIELYKTVLNKDPKRVDVLMSIAILDFEQNNYEEAEEYINKILVINPNNVEAIYNIGVMEARKGNFAAAKQNWTKIVNEFPNNKLVQTAKNSLQKLEENNKN
ncbi:MAG: tetratricopeptide repeat protein [Ignavibacteriae bacterium]|nr:tetratricopeptide repeat protein [Ignavibacteriota bacterium]